MWYSRFHPVTWIQGSLTTICRSGSTALNRPSMTRERMKVSAEVISAVQRTLFGLSFGRKRITSTPRSGKKVTTFRIEKTNSILNLGGRYRRTK